MQNRYLLDTNTCPLTILAWYSHFDKKTCLWTHTYPTSEIMRSWKCFLDVSGRLLATIYQQYFSYIVKTTDIPQFTDKLYHKAVSSTSCQTWESISQHLVMIGITCIGRCKSISYPMVDTTALRICKSRSSQIFTYNFIFMSFMNLQKMYSKKANPLWVKCLLFIAT